MNAVDDEEDFVGDSLTYYVEIGCGFKVRRMVSAW
jgi:hypothetical protein